MNTPVSFSLAKLVRLKGFNEPCSSFYRDGELSHVNSLVTDKKLVTNSQFLTSRYFTAPSISDVVMWLYKEHGIWISVDPDNDTDIWFYTISHNKSETVFGNYSSLTEAYEAGIEDVLINMI